MENKNSKKEKLNWFQRRTTTEVIGRVTGKECGYRGIMYQPVTFYAVTQADETVYRGALLGHQPTPKLGDNVEMYLEKGKVLVRREEPTQRTMPDGSVEVISQLMVWEPIRSYRVLEDLV